MRGSVPHVRCSVCLNRITASGVVECWFVSIYARVCVCMCVCVYFGVYVQWRNG